MALVQLAEISGAQAKLNSQGEREYTRQFRVIRDDNLDGAQVVVGNTPGIPRLGDPYATATDLDLGAVCKAVEVQQDEDAPRVWKIRVEYGPGTEQERNENPFLRPADIGWSFTKGERACWRDIDGRAICNSAGS